MTGAAPSPEMPSLVRLRLACAAIALFACLDAVYLLASWLTSGFRDERVFGAIEFVGALAGMGLAGAIGRASSSHLVRWLAWPLGGVSGALIGAAIFARVQGFPWPLLVRALYLGGVFGLQAGTAIMLLDRAFRAGPGRRETM